MNIKPENYKEIFGLAVAALLAIGAYWRGAKNERVTLAALVALIGATLVSVMIIRWEIIPRIEEHQQQNQELANRVNKDPTLKMSVEAYSSASDSIKKAPVQLQKAFFEKVGDWHNCLSDISTGRFVVPRDAIIGIASELIRTATTSVIGTSYVKSSDWWRKPEGEHYLKLNEQLIRRGGTIDRIFIFSSQEQLKADEELMRRQKEMGIHVSYVLSQDVAGYTEDMIVIDNSVSGTLRLNPDKGMSAAEFYWDDRNCKRIGSEINAIVRQARTFE